MNARLQSKLFQSKLFQSKRKSSSSAIFRLPAVFVLQVESLMFMIYIWIKHPYLNQLNRCGTKLLEGEENHLLITEALQFVGELYQHYLHIFAIQIISYLAKYYTLHCILFAIQIMLILFDLIFATQIIYFSSWHFAKYLTQYFI